MRLTCGIRTFIGDYDALSKAWGGKPAAALKPCFRCHNILMKCSAIPEMDSSFHSIASHEVNKFQAVLNKGLTKAFDDLIGEFGNACKFARAEKETIFGFSLDVDGLLGCRKARSVLRVELSLFDSMHCYYSKGIAGQELLLITNLLQERLSATVKDLRESVMNVLQCQP